MNYQHVNIKTTVAEVADCNWTSISVGYRQKPGVGKHGNREHAANRATERL